MIFVRQRERKTMRMPPHIMKREKRNSSEGGGSTSLKFLESSVSLLLQNFCSQKKDEKDVQKKDGLMHLIPC
jgi:hypothetical protein